jgi:peptide deformylase
MDLVTGAMDYFEEPAKALEVIDYPDEVLRKVSRPVLTAIKDDRDLQQLIRDMTETVVRLHAVGLSAIQVGVPLRVMVIQDVNLRPMALINPVINWVKGSQYATEGCLSFKSVFERIKRPEEVEATFFDADGNLKTTVFKGLLARAVVHEEEHMQGILFIDNMNFLQKDKALKTLKKFKKQMKMLGH